MAREIIIVDIQRVPNGAGGFLFQPTCVFWLAAPANRTIPKPGFASAVPSLAAQPTWGIQASELSALQAGTVVEQIYVGTPLATVNAVEADLQASYAAAQTALNNSAPPAKFLGASWDGAAWTVP